MTDFATVMQVMFDDMPDDKRASNRVGRSYPGKHYFLGQLLVVPTLHGLPHHAPCRLKTVNIVGSCTLWLTGIVPLSHSSDLFIALFEYSTEPGRATRDHVGDNLVHRAQVRSDANGKLFGGE